MENNLENTSQHSVIVTQISETSKRCRTNTSPSSPLDGRFVSLADFSTWKAKLLILETLLKSKDTTIADLTNQVSQLTIRIGNLENELKVANDKTMDLETQVEKQRQEQTPLRSWISVASQAVAQIEGKKVDRPQEQIEVLNSVVCEQKERERRKKYIIVFGVPMSSKTTQEGQVADDKGFIERAFKAIKIDVKKIKNIRRFKPNPNLNRPPPILIQLNGDSDRPFILRAAKELRKFSEYSGIYINPDLTEAERILDRKRREDRFNLNQQERSRSTSTRYFISGDRFRRFTVEPSCGADSQMHH
ncbi:unnamed protein product [Brachionus calyciflorus]|uniref:L1 transposable element RRM domain-containing protein n=1 Tax=Brachionus calyciflorus TaxID=104777 RepID=A0A814AS51_9BILA|nr:unnamed protein product [Brachionus calyciflorus]